jgi:predicted nucleotidyltransferase
MLPDMAPRIHSLIQPEPLVELCRRWAISELSLFGSALRDDFRPDSDLDLLVTFAPDAPWSGWEFVRLQSELEALFGRKVDLAERAAVETSENWIRRQHILEHAEPIYVAR